VETFQEAFKTKFQKKLRNFQENNGPSNAKIPGIKEGGLNKEFPKMVKITNPPITILLAN